MSSFPQNRRPIEVVSGGSTGFLEPLNSKYRFAVRDDRQLVLPQNLNWQMDTNDLMHDYSVRPSAQRISGLLEQNVCR
jgi:predicted phosphohydrolase